MKKAQIGRATLVAMMVAAVHTGCAAPPDESASDAPDEHLGSAASAWTTTPWEDRGGTLVGAPAAASWDPGRMDVFVRGTDDALWHYWYQSGVWSGDTQGGVLTSAPAVASWGPGKLDVFVRGTDYALHHRGYDGAAGGWGEWEYLGGYLTSAPAVASSRPGRLDVFVLGGGGTLWRRTYDDRMGGWQGWDPLGQPPGGGSWKFDPAATRSMDGGGVDVFVVGPSNNLLSNRFSVDSGPAWNPNAWMSWGGYVNATPAVVSWPGHVEALVLGGAPGGPWPLYRRSIDTLTGDSQFQWLGGDYHTAVAAAAPEVGSIHLFTAANDDHSLLHAYTTHDDVLDDDLPQQQALAQHYFPSTVRTAVGENCVAPASSGQSTGVAFYKLGHHPRNPDALMASYALAFRQDCGLAGHAGANGVAAHPGDIEYFFETLTKDASCSTGYRLHAIKTVAHSGDYKLREVNERILDTCDPPSEVVLSLGKHALYLSWLDCSKRTPAEVCSGSGTIGFNLYNMDADVAALFPPEDGESARDKLFVAQGDGRFCGGQKIGNRDECIAVPETKLRRAQTGKNFDEWELPDPGLGGDHTCPYGLESSVGLCYKHCDPGYSGTMTMCIPGCPSGFRDDGLYCAKPGPYGRGVGYPWEFSDFPDFGLGGAFSRCESDYGPGNCEQCLAVVYPRCAPGFHAVGCNICSPDCPSDTTDIGVSCQKHTYDRGVGCLP